MNNPLNNMENEQAIGTDTVEAVCPNCNTVIATKSDKSEIYCNECKCVVMQLPICTKKSKGDYHGLYT